MRNEINEIKISYCEKLGVIDSEPMSNSEKIAELLYKAWDKDTIGLHETFKVLLLNNGNKVKGVYQLSSGGLTAVTVDIRILFAVILKSLSAGIVLAHNHPSGTLIPSKGDKEVTQKIKRAALLLDITVLDHLIITPTGKYYSFADDGML